VDGDDDPWQQIPELDWAVAGGARRRSVPDSINAPLLLAAIILLALSPILVMVVSSSR
jgi:hypothetical protein